jgi:anti-anti-sigma factor
MPLSYGVTRPEGMQMRDPGETPEARLAVLGDRRNGVDRLSLIGELDGSTASLLEAELDDVAHAGGAVVLDLHHIESVEPEAVEALEEMGRRAGDGGWLLFIVNVHEPVRDAFEREGADELLSDDVVDLLSSADGDWAPISLPPLPGQRTRMTRLGIVEEVPR